MAYRIENYLEEAKDEYKAKRDVILLNIVLNKSDIDYKILLILELEN